MVELRRGLNEQHAARQLQMQLSDNQWRTVAEWVLAVCFSYRAAWETIERALQLMATRFHHSKLPSTRMQLTAAAAMWVSSKYEDAGLAIHSSDLLDLCRTPDGPALYTMAELYAEERHLLQAVRYTHPSVYVTTVLDALTFEARSSGWVLHNASLLLFSALLEPAYPSSDPSHVALAIHGLATEASVDRPRHASIVFADKQQCPEVKQWRRRLLAGVALLTRADQRLESLCLVERFDERYEQLHAGLAGSS